MTETEHPSLTLYWSAAFKMFNMYPCTHEDRLSCAHACKCCFHFSQLELHPSVKFCKRDVINIFIFKLACRPVYLLPLNFYVLHVGHKYAKTKNIIF